MIPDQRSPTRGRRSVVRVVALAAFAALVATVNPSIAGAVAIDGLDTRSLGGTTVIVVDGVGRSDLGQIREIVGRSATIELLDELGVATVEVPSARAAATMRSIASRAAGAIDVSIDPVWSADAVTPNDVDWAGFQSSFAAVELPEAWGSTTGASSAVIAIVDSGVNPVAELSGRLLGGIDLVDGDGVPEDVDGHGTSSALVVAAAGNNSANGAGACWACLVLPVRVLDAQGSGRASTVAAGIVWATDNGAGIINLSLGGATRSSAVAAAIRYAVSRNVVVVASAGNDGSADVRYPAAEPGVIAVAAAQSLSTLYSWSQRGSWIDVAAPGCNYSWSGAAPLDTDDYYFCGTSSAAPLVSGVVGLMRSIRPGATRVMVSNALRAGPATISTGSSSVAPFLAASAAIEAVRSAADGPELDNNPLDISGPTVSMGGEAIPGRVVSGTMRLTTNATDPAGLSSWDLLVDGALRGSVVPQGGSVGIVDFDTLSVGDGPRSLVVRAIDAFGLESQTAAVPVVVDNTRPGLIIFAPPSGRGGRPVTVTVGVADATDVAATFLAIGNQVVGGFVGQGVRQFNVVLPRSGRHRLVAASIDVAGNLSLSNQVFVTARRR